MKVRIFKRFQISIWKHFFNWWRNLETISSALPSNYPNPLEGTIAIVTLNNFLTFQEVTPIASAWLKLKSSPHTQKKSHSNIKWGHPHISYFFFPISPPKHSLCLIMASHETDLSSPIEELSSQPGAQITRYSPKPSHTHTPTTIHAFTSSSPPSIISHDLVSPNYTEQLVSHPNACHCWPTSS